MNLTIPPALRNFIGGHFCSPQSGMYLPVINPATGKLLCQMPDSGAEDLESAIQSAQNAFPAWSRTTPEERFNMLNLIAFLITEHCEALAMAETTNNGTPICLSRKTDIPRAAANFRFFATAAMQFSSECHSGHHQQINYTLRQPVGIVGCISPCSHPLYLFSWKIAPALAAGNCVIAKPSEVTPVMAYLLSAICYEAGLPPGVLNVLYGKGSVCGDMIVNHPAIKTISFTGSTPTGRQVAARAAGVGGFKKLSLEMGSKNPSIIFADCNWEKMMGTTMKSCFSSQGQFCLCSRRLLVERSLYQRFKEEFVQRTAALKVGSPANEENDLGAIVSKSCLERIIQYISMARNEGGKILCGGHAVSPDEENYENGFYFEPTVIEGLGPDAETNQQEVFGPVVTLQSFETEAEALQLANASGYGLAATIWTENGSRANRMAAQVENGIVWINCWQHHDLRVPFGGIKNSGMGRQGGWEAMRFFTEAKNVCLAF